MFYITSIGTIKLLVSCKGHSITTQTFFSAFLGSGCAACDVCSSIHPLNVWMTAMMSALLEGSCRKTTAKPNWGTNWSWGFGPREAPVVVLGMAQGSERSLTSEGSAAVAFTSEFQKCNEYIIRCYG